MAFKLGAIAVLTAAAVLAAFFIDRSVPLESGHATIEVVVGADAMPAAPPPSTPEKTDEGEKSAAIDLGAPSGAVAPVGSAGAPATFIDIGPLAATSENQGKSSLSAPPVASGGRACKASGKARVHPATPSEPEKDLMEP
jgi:hypothetical protein